MFIFWLYALLACTFDLLSGDKYINGTIIPRPPPVQYGRQQGRYGDRNRNYDRPRMSQQGQGSYGQRGPMPSGDGRNYDNTPPQQQNYAPTGPRGDGRYQGTYNQGGQGGNYYPPPEQRDRGNYSSPPPPPPPPHYGGADRQGGGGYGYNQNYSRQGGQQSNYSPENYSGQGGHQSNYSPETYSGQGGQQSNHSPVGQPGTDRVRFLFTTSRVFIPIHSLRFSLCKDWYNQEALHLLIYMGSGFLMRVDPHAIQWDQHP